MTRTRPDPRRILLRPVLRPVLMAGLCLLPLPAMALVPDFRAPATPMAERREDRASYQLPLGPWRDGALPVRTVEGQISQTAWRIDGGDIATVPVLAALRAQIVAAGYDVLFECDTLNCGGFDFRYATETLPEPEMHVDLGDFRFLSAERQGPKGTEALSLLVSRSADRGFVQLTLVAQELTTPPVFTTSTKSAEAGAPAAPAQATAAADPPAPQSALASALDGGQTVALDDLVFASGAAVLEEGRYASLGDLAAWIGADPSRRVTLVGHTDSSGSAAANTALSLARAEAVRDRLIRLHGVAADRLAVRGDGPAAPRADNATPEGRAKNRRVEVEPTPTP